MTGLLWALPALPATVGAAVAISGRRGARVAGPVAIGTVAATAGIAGWAMVTRPAVEAAWVGPLRAGLAVDGLSAVMVGTLLVIAEAVLVYAAGDIEEAQPRFFALMLLFVAAMLGTVTATSLAFLLLFWEIMGACSWGLIGFWWYEPDRPPCANTAFLVTKGADIGLYLATAAALTGAATVEMAVLDERLASPWLHVVAFGALVAAAGKSAQLPFSSWLAAAMQGPSPVSALLHSATMVAAGAYLVLRLFPVLDASGWAAEATAWWGAVTALVLGLFALAQRDLKQLLAASTSAQVGFMFLAAGAAAVPAGAAHFVAHGVLKSLLFMGAGVYIRQLHTRYLDELAGRGGGPLAGATRAFALGALSLAALPPLAGWVSKDDVLAGARHEGIALWALALAASLVTALYAARALLVLWQPGRPEPAPAAELPPRRLTAPMWALAAVTVGFAAVAIPAAARAWDRLIGGPAAPSPTAFERGLSAAIALAGLAVAYRWLQAGRLAAWRPALVPPAARNALYWWLWLEQAGFHGLVLPARRLAAALARFDDRIVDRGVEATGRAAAALAGSGRRFDDRVVDAGVHAAARTAAAVAGVARRADDLRVDGLVRAATGGTVRSAVLSRLSDERLVDRAVEGIAAGVRRAGGIARRPQTGMPHQYYTQAVATLFVLAVVFLSLVATR